MEPTNAAADFTPKRDRFKSSSHYRKQPLRASDGRDCRREKMARFRRMLRSLAAKKKRGPVLSAPARPSRRGRKRRNVNQECAGCGDDGMVLGCTPTKKKSAPGTNSCHFSSPDSSVSSNLDYSVSAGSPSPRSSFRGSSRGSSRRLSRASSGASSQASSLVGLAIFGSPSLQGSPLRLDEEITFDNKEANSNDNDATAKDDEKTGPESSSGSSLQHSGPPVDLESEDEVAVKDAVDHEDMHDLGSARRNQVPNSASAAVSNNEKLEENAVIKQGENETNNAEEVPEVALRVGGANNSIDEHSSVPGSASLIAEAHTDDKRVSEDPTARPIDGPVVEADDIEDVVESSANEGVDTGAENDMAGTEAHAGETGTAGDEGEADAAPASEDKVAVGDAFDHEDMHDLGSARRNQVPNSASAAASNNEKLEENTATKQDENGTNNAEEVPEVALRVGGANNFIDEHSSVPGSASLIAEARTDDERVSEDPTARSIDGPVVEADDLEDVVFESSANEGVDTGAETDMAGTEADAGETGTAGDEGEADAATANNQEEASSSRPRRSPRLQMRRRVSKRELDGLKSTLNGPYWNRGLM